MTVLPGWVTAEAFVLDEAMFALHDCLGLLREARQRLVPGDPLAAAIDGQLHFIILALHCFAELQAERGPI